LGKRKERNNIGFLVKEKKKGENQKGDAKQKKKRQLHFHDTGTHNE